MTKLSIKFTDVEKIKEFVAITERQTFNVDVTCGRQIVDAKSILGVLSIDMSKKYWVVIHADEEDCKEYVNSISNYLA